VTNHPAEVAARANDIEARDLTPPTLPASLHTRTAPRDPSRASLELVIEGEPLSLLQGLRETWTFREVAVALAERNVRVKYKQAALGVAWALIQPLSFLVIFVVIFGRAAGLSRGMTSYAAFALSTLVPWMFVQSAVSSGSQALLSDGILLKKIYFAREAPVLGAVLGSCLDFAVGLGLVLILGPFLGARFSWATLLAIPLWAVLALLVSGMALGFSALTVYYRDFRYVLPLFLQVWMYASPVAYPVTAVPPQWQLVYTVANPAAGILDGFRRVLAEGRLPDFTLLAVSVATTVIIAWLGYLIFKRLEPGFTDAI
jgi:lipopolysaccharide transport system permease protein